MDKQVIIPKYLQDAINPLSRGYPKKVKLIVFDEPKDPSAKMDFLKQRVGIEVAFGHSSFIGIDLLKFQVASYSGLDKIDVGVYVVTTKNFQKIMKSRYNKNWEGSLRFEKVERYLPHFKSAIQLPIYVIGIDF